MRDVEEIYREMTEEERQAFDHSLDLNDKKGAGNILEKHEAKKKEVKNMKFTGKDKNGYKLELEKTVSYNKERWSITQLANGDITVRGHAVDRLAEFEEIGLYPEQIRMMNSMYQDSMRDIKKTEDYYYEHRQQCENWTHGEPQRCWIDENEDFCIKYLDGSCWSYKKNGEELKWKRKGAER